MTNEKTYTLTALEDISYRVANSYPKDGFFVPKGESIRIVESALKILQVRKWNTKHKGKYTLTEVK